MFLSVVMANFNGETYIEEAIKSVLDQEERSFEFIVVDDGSTDRSRQIIERYCGLSDGRMKLIIQRENRGQAESLNLGISRAKGDIVCFLDSDDVWFNKKLSDVKKEFSRNNHAAFHQHNLLVMRNDELTKNTFKDILVAGDYFAYTQKTRTLPFFSPTSGLSFRRKILDLVLPIPSVFRTCADGYLTRTAFCYGSVSANTESWGAYRIHGANHTVENQKFDNDKYKHDLLIPHLNKFYLANGIDLKLHRKNFITKLFSVSPKSVLLEILSDRTYSRFENFIEGH